MDKHLLHHIFYPIIKVILVDDVFYITDCMKDFSINILVKAYFYIFIFCLDNINFNINVTFFTLVVILCASVKEEINVKSFLLIYCEMNVLNVILNELIVFHIKNALNLT